MDEIGKKPEEFQEHDRIKKGIKMFFTEKEEALFTSLGREISESWLQESFLLYRINKEKTMTNFYGESKNKVYHPEIQIFGRINVESLDPEYHVDGGLLKQGFGKLTAGIYLDHLKELGLVEYQEGHDVVLSVRVGDFIGFKGQFYEIKDNGYSQISNQFSWAGDRRFYIRVTAIEVDEDRFRAR